MTEPADPIERSRHRLLRRTAVALLFAGTAWVLVFAGLASGVYGVSGGLLFASLSALPILPLALLAWPIAQFTRRRDLAAWCAASALAVALLLAFVGLGFSVAVWTDLL